MTTKLVNVIEKRSKSVSMVNQDKNYLATNGIYIEGHATLHDILTCSDACWDFEAIEKICPELREAINNAINNGINITDHKSIKGSAVPITSHNEFGSIKSLAKKLVASGDDNFMLKYSNYPVRISLFSNKSSRIQNDSGVKPLLIALYAAYKQNDTRYFDLRFKVEAYYDDACAALPAETALCRSQEILKKTCKKDYFEAAYRSTNVVVSTVANFSMLVNNKAMHKMGATIYVSKSPINGVVNGLLGLRTSSWKNPMDTKEFAASYNKINNAASRRGLLKRFGEFFDWVNKFVSLNNVNPEYFIDSECSHYCWESLYNYWLGITSIDRKNILKHIKQSKNDLHLYSDLDNTEDIDRVTWKPIKGAYYTTRHRNSRCRKNTTLVLQEIDSYK